MLFGETTNDSSLSKEALRTSLTSTTPSHMQTYESAATKVPIMVSPRAGDQDTMPAAEEAEEVLDEQHVEKQELDMADDVTTLAGGEKKEKFMHTVSSMVRRRCFSLNSAYSILLTLSYYHYYARQEFAWVSIYQVA